MQFNAHGKAQWRIQEIDHDSPLTAVVQRSSSTVVHQTPSFLCGGNDRVRGSALGASVVAVGSALRGDRYGVRTAISCDG